jgi:agmatine/peptidylarginine deiminase
MKATRKLTKEKPNPKKVFFMVPSYKKSSAIKMVVPNHEKQWCKTYV